jgi:hypothetical protein
LIFKIEINNLYTIINKTLGEFKMKKSIFLSFIALCAVFLLNVFLFNSKAISEIKEGPSPNMCPLEEMLKTHPYPPIIEFEGLISGIKTINGCAKICVICADACVGEKDPELTRCIRLDLDCADICGTTATLLSRQTETNKVILCKQLKACALACNKCGQECEMHAEKYEHCRICAEVCFGCKKTCNDLLEELEKVEKMV